MKCSFCGDEIKLDRAVYYYTATGKGYVFCSSKCRRSMLKLRRDPKKLKWVNG
ncbi:MAG: hypothetical protein QW465_02465 [Candidatus Anstonellales archaeon]